MGLLAARNAIKLVVSVPATPAASERMERLSCMGESIASTAGRTVSIHAS